MLKRIKIINDFINHKKEIKYINPEIKEIFQDFYLQKELKEIEPSFFTLSLYFFNKIGKEIYVGFWYACLGLFLGSFVIDAVFQFNVNSLDIGLGIMMLLFSSVFFQVLLSILLFAFVLYIVFSFSIFNELKNKKTEESGKKIEDYIKKTLSFNPLETNKALEVIFKNKDNAMGLFLFIVLIEYINNNELNKLNNLMRNF